MTRTKLGLGLLLSAVVSLACNGDDTTDAADTTGTSGGPSGNVTSGPSSLTTGVDDTGSDDAESTDDTTGDDTGSDDTTDGSTGGDGPIPADPPGETITCDNKIAAAPAGEICGVTEGNGTLLLQGTVLAGYDVYEAGMVLVDTSQPNGRILCTGCDCANAPEAAGATVVACPEGVIAPGLINTHDHITFTLSQPIPHDTERYEHRHEWRLGLDGATELNTFPGSDNSREGVLYGELRMLFGGATSVTGSVGGAAAQDLARNLDRAELTGGLAGVDVNYRTFPLGDTGGQMMSTGCGYPNVDGAFNLEDDIYLPHVSEGITAQAQNEFECMSGAPGGQNLIASNTSLIHGVGLLATDVQEMANVDAMLVWSPRSNIDLYGVTADIPVFRNLGVRIALGTDWSASGSMNMLRELACADSFNQEHLEGQLSDVELFMMATHWAAASQGASEQLGLLRTGHIADIAIFDGSEHAAHRAIIEGESDSVRLVLRGGQPLHGDASLIEALVDPMDLAACEPVDVCGTDKRICAELDSGLTIAQIQAAVSPDAYPMFFCGAPDNEPSCDPARPGQFPERGGVDDPDGDGIPDAEDNCPNVFNPLKPVHGGVQGDADFDEVGDSCDLCPLDPDQACVVPSPFDLDGDGIEDTSDNCLAIPNPGQEDDDDDGIGDDCDGCPMAPNPGGGPCPSSIYDIKDGTISENQAVIVPEVLVTGVAATGYFVQVHPADAGYMGVDYSGMFVFDNGGFAQPTAGDYVDVEGTVSDFFGQIQLIPSAAPTVVSSGNPLPAPEPVSATDIVEGGMLQEELEGVVVEVAALTVTDIAPAAGPGDDGMNEFEVTDGLRVNDLFYVADPFPTVGQEYATLRGIARWANDYTKLEPRSLTDYPTSLLSFGPADTFLLNGTMAEPIPGLTAELSGPAPAITPIALAYSDATVVTGPAFVNVPAGSSSVAVILTGVSVGTADVTASLDGTDIMTSVRVYDDAEPRIPTLSPAALNLGLGAMSTMTVTLDLPAPLAAGQDVDLAFAPGMCATTPPLVNVPASDLSAEFDITALACTGDEVLTATIAPATSDAMVTIVDSPVFAAPIVAEVYYDHDGGDDGFEWVKLYNGTGVAIDLSDYSLGWGGTDYTYGTLDLTGMLPDGACYLVGGPMGDPGSGFPGPVMFDQAEDFSPDIQNSNGAGLADAVALFESDAASINAGSVPVDAVIYGSDNTNGLLDETGAPGAVDVGDAPGGSSIRLGDDGMWAINPSPAPLDCLPFP